MLFLIAVLLFVVILIAWSCGMMYHKRRLRLEAERSAVWQADEDFHAENPGMPMRYWKPESWDQFTRKITEAFEERRLDQQAKDYDYDCEIRDRFAFVICTTGIDDRELCAECAD